MVPKRLQKKIMKQQLGLEYKPMKITNYTTEILILYIY